MLRAILYGKVLPANRVTKYLPDLGFWPMFCSQSWNNENLQTALETVLVCAKTRKVCPQEESGPGGASGSRPPTQFDEQ